MLQLCAPRTKTKTAVLYAVHGRFRFPTAGVLNVKRAGTGIIGYPTARTYDTAPYPYSTISVGTKNIAALIPWHPVL